MVSGWLVDLSFSSSYSCAKVKSMATFEILRLRNNTGYIFTSIVWVLNSNGEENMSLIFGMMCSTVMYREKLDKRVS